MNKVTDALKLSHDLSIGLINIKGLVVKMLINFLFATV